MTVAGRVVTVAGTRLPTVIGAEADADRVGRLLAAQHLGVVPVQPVVVAAAGTRLKVAGRPRGVLVVTADQLRARLLEKPAVLAADEVASVVRLLDAPEYWGPTAEAQPDLLQRFTELETRTRPADSGSSRAEPAIPARNVLSVRGRSSVRYDRVLSAPRPRRPRRARAATPRSASTAPRMPPRSATAAAPSRDGPFAELAEPVVAADVLEAEGLEDALRAVVAHPPVADGVIELRALLGEDDDAPTPAPARSGRRYLLLHALPADRPTTPAPTRSLPEWLADPRVQAAVLEGDRLQPATAETAASVRMRAGEATVSRGAAAEVTEAIAGYDLIAAEHLDEAIAIARPHPTLGFGVIEIRPLVWT